MADVDARWCASVESAWSDYRDARTAGTDGRVARDALLERWQETVDGEGADQASDDVLRLLRENVRTAWLGPGRVTQIDAAKAVTNGLAVLASSCAARGHAIEGDTGGVPLDADGDVRAGARPSG